MTLVFCCTHFCFFSYLQGFFQFNGKPFFLFCINFVESCKVKPVYFFLILFNFNNPNP